MKRAADDWSVKKQMAMKMNWWSGGMTGERKGRQSINVPSSQDAEPCNNIIDH
jgi:hypothetical protein